MKLVANNYEYKSSVMFTLFVARETECEHSERFVFGV